jgi:GT2 family glycosyltransferase|tara:strand:+ start:1480 stop:2337 length:858 start_codon:yes stop_codon:yes gene_type:complete
MNISEVTVIMVSFYSQNLIEKTINFINKEIKIIVVENSNSLPCKEFLEKKYSNVKVILSKENLGNGAGINTGIKNANTKYAFYIDIDTEIQKNTIINLLEEANKTDDFALLAPLVENYNYKKTDYYEDEKLEDSNQRRMNFVPGCAMFFNINKIEQIGLFDENFFLFFEENDIYMRCHKNNLKIYLIKSAKIIHTGEKSVDKKFNENVELIRNWHLMWSKFYFYKKHFGVFVAYKNTLGHLVSGVIKLILFRFLSKKNYLKYKFRVSGLINSYIGKKSWKRPIVN